MILRCVACTGTEFAIESFDLIGRIYDSADIEDPWSHSEQLEESYVVSARCADCDKEYPPGLFGLRSDRLQERVKEILREAGSRIAKK